MRVRSDLDMIQVVAAVLEREGRILVGQRQARQTHPLQWEFPGGSPEAALARELEEELDIRGAEGPEIARYRFVYPGKDPIELIFFRVLLYTGEPRNVIFHDLQWHPKLRLGELDFVEGDREFLRGIYTSAYGDNDQENRSRGE